METVSCPILHKLSLGKKANDRRVNLICFPYFGDHGPTQPMVCYLKIVFLNISYHFLIVCNKKVSLKKVTCSRLETDVLLSCNNIRDILNEKKSHCNETCMVWSHYGKI